MTELCFVLMICWNQHMVSVEMYIFSVNPVLMTCWMLKVQVGHILGINEECQFQFQGQPMFNY